MDLPRTIVTGEGWGRAIDQLAGGDLKLLALWGDAPNVHMAMLDEQTSAITLLSYACVNGT
jgi:hypothetical protein